MATQVVGIDFGHMYSSAVVLREGEVKPRVVTFMNVMGSAIDALPTVVAYPQANSPQVGDPLLAWIARDPRCVVYNFKRLLGRPYDNSLQGVLSGLGWRAVADSNGSIAAQLDDAISPVPLSDVATKFFRHLYDATVAQVKKTIDQVAISVPACFATPQVEAIMAAARAAGWPEPHACRDSAALAAVLARYRIHEGRLAALCDLGGGKFEVSVVEFGGQGVFRLLATCGEPLLGGDDLDNRIVEAIAIDLVKQGGPDLRYDLLARLRIQSELNAARPALYRQDQVELHLPFITLKSDRVPVHARMTLTRELHDGLIADMLARIEAACMRALEQAAVDRWDLRGNVLATGGYTTLRAYERVADRSLGAISFLPNKQLVAYGAALLAQNKVGNTGE